MKKRTLPVLAVVAALSSAAFVACGEDHTHDYKWDSNADAHWQICECGDKTAEEAHVDVKNNETGADGADELCDACGRNLHVHNYTWHSDGAGHWEECVCGDKHDAVAHVDEKNNADTNVAEPDGKCDVCGHNIHAVTFDVLGHGTAPKAQYIGEGAHAADPGELADDDSWKFKGWYKDEDCSVAYDFAAETVSGATTIYAKWVEDDTAGASKKYAHVLALGEENLMPATLESSVYYKYTSTASGRYKVELALGASATGTFTVDAADGTYGHECDAQSVTIDLDEGDTVYILYTYKGASTDGITVSPVVSAVADESLPADRYPSGTYVSADGSVRAEFNHATKHLVSDLGDTTVKYLGGKYDMLYFTADEQGHIGTIKPGENGAYLLKLPGADEPVALYVQPSVALSAISGYYEPADAGAKTFAITELYIYQSSEADATSLRYKMVNDTTSTTYVDISGLYDAEYDAVLNKLTCDLFSVTVNLDANGAVASINLGENKYLRKTAAPAIPPEKLPLGDNSEYNGTTTVIRDSSGMSQYLGEGYDGITVMDYDQSTDTYSVLVYTYDIQTENHVYVKYTMAFKNEGNTIELRDADGALVDTLTKFVWNIQDLPATQDTDNVTADDFQKGLRLYRVTQAGWYSFALVTEGYATGYYGLNPNDYTQLYDAHVIGEAPIYLAAGELIAIHMYEPAAAALTVTPAEAPVGTAEASPKVLEDGVATVDINSTQTYYFRYTAPTAGNYLVYVIHDGYSPLLIYTVNGTTYGYDDNELSYIGITRDNPYAAVTVAAGNLDLDIRVECLREWDNVTVVVAKDLSADATPLTEDQGELSAGTYKIEDVTDIDCVIISADEDVTVAYLTESLTEEEITDHPVYLYNGGVKLNLGFTVSGAATYTIRYVEGSQKKPMEIDDFGEIEVEDGTYIKITAPNDEDLILMATKGDAEYYASCFVYNDERYGYESTWDGDVPHDKVSLKIPRGQTVTVRVICDDGQDPWERYVRIIVGYDLTEGATSVVFEEDHATISATGNYYIESSDDKYVTITGTSAFTVKLSTGSTLEAVADEDGKYVVEIGAAEDLYFNVSFEGTQTLALTLSAPIGTADNPEALELEDGMAAVEFGYGVEQYYIVLPEGVYSFNTRYDYIYVFVNDTYVGTSMGEITVEEGDVVRISAPEGYGCHMVFTVVEE